MTGSEYAVAAQGLDAESAAAVCFDATPPGFMLVVAVIESTFLLLYVQRCICFIACLVPAVCHGGGLNVSLFLYLGMVWSSVLCI